MKKRKFAIAPIILFVCALIVFPFSKNQDENLKNTATASAQTLKAVQIAPNLSEPLEFDARKEVKEAAQKTPLLSESKTAPDPTGVKAASPSPAPKTAGMAIEIPKISVRASVAAVGLKSNGELYVPNSAAQTGWYKYSPLPGEIGTSVITGHMDFGANFAPAVFYNLRRLAVGDEIYVTRADGSVAVFSVKFSEVYPQNNFPTQKVYSPASGAELRIITCAGSYDKNTKRYTDNLVVYAALSRILPAS